MKRADILERAKEVVTKDRERVHGKAEDNFAVIADFWNVYENAKTNALLSRNELDGFVQPDGSVSYDFSYTAEDVAIMMALLKIARIATGTAKADSFIDAAGYIACGGELAEC